jgi:hypothetical protein
MCGCEDEGTGNEEASAALNGSELFIVDTNPPDAVVGEVAQIK